jgi:hypothetical protein
VEARPDGGSLLEEPALGDRPESVDEPVPESVDEPVDATVPSKTRDVTPASGVSATEAAVAELWPGDVAIDPVAALWPAGSVALRA